MAQDMAAHAEFDLAVMLLIGVIMPLTVWLLSKRSSLLQVGSILLLLFSVCWIGVFEHYRLHSPHVTRQGLATTFRTAAVAAAMTQTAAPARTRLLRGSDTDGSDGHALSASFLPLTGTDAHIVMKDSDATLVHLHSPHCSDAFLGGVFKRLMWSRAQMLETDQVSELAALTPHRAVVTVCNPRAIVHELSLAHTPGDGAATEKDFQYALKSSALYEYERDVRTLSALQRSSNVTFVRDEDLNPGSRAAFEALAAYFGLDEASTVTFVEACEATVAARPADARAENFPPQLEKLFRLQYSALLQGLGYKAGAAY